jgi:hypothetical protein
MTVFDPFPSGFSWFPREAMTRTGHALDAGDDGVWLVDPVDVPEAMERAATLGPPAGVIQLLDRHNRDCAAIAARLGVPHLKVPDVVRGSPFEVVKVLDIPGWHEAALWWPGPRVLVVAEIVGTNAAYRVGDGVAGIHAALRLLPPRALRGYQPEHLLVGHGRGVHGADAALALEQAYADSRRDLPKLAIRLPGLVKGAVKSR